jgi:hypothetical protein
MTSQPIEPQHTDTPFHLAAVAPAFPIFAPDDIEDLDSTADASLPAFEPETSAPMAFPSDLPTLVEAPVFGMPVTPFLAETSPAGPVVAREILSSEEFSGEASSDDAPVVDFGIPLDAPIDLPAPINYASLPGEPPADITEPAPVSSRVEPYSDEELNDILEAIAGSVTNDTDEPVVAPGIEFVPVITTVAPTSLDTDAVDSAAAENSVDELPAESDTPSIGDEGPRDSASIFASRHAGHGTGVAPTFPSIAQPNNTAGRIAEGMYSDGDTPIHDALAREYGYTLVALNRH